MKKFINKVLLLLLVLFVGISLTACDDKDNKNDTTNKNVPYGNLSSDTIYASVGDIKLSEKALYDELRVNGYDYLLDEMVKVLINPSQYDVTNEEIKAEIKDIINEQCYGTSDEDALKEMNESTKATYRKKFKDQMFMLNVSVTDTEEGIYSDECLNHFLNQYAQKEYVRNLLTAEDSKYYWANEFMTNDDNEEVDNPYYISEDAIESAYNSTKNSDATYNVIIIGYNTLAEAQKALDSKDVNALTYADFETLYTNKYGFKENNFNLTDADLAKYDSSLVTLVKNMNEKHEGAEDFTSLVYQQFGNTVYHVCLKGKKAEADYDALEDKTNAKKETVEEIVDNKLTSSTISKLLFEKLYDTNVVIYDPVFDALYAAENSEHKRLEANQWNAEYNNYVAKIGETYITVENFNKKLEEILGVSTAMDYFTSHILLKSEYANKITADDLKEIDKTYNEIISSFESDTLASSGLPAAIGKDVFKFVYFGTTNEDEIKEYYKSQKAWDYYVESKPDNYYQLIEEFGKQYVGTNEGEEAYNGKFFDLSVKHILLTVDFNGDGTPDDPEIFYNKLLPEKQADLHAEIVKTMNKIVEEVNFLVEEKGYASLTEALDFVKEAYYANAKLQKDPSDNWSNYKSIFNLGLTIEDLGSVNNSTVSKYVKEFGIGVKALYEKLEKENKLKDDYLAPSVTSIEELIKTSFGYHILAVYDSSSVSSAKYNKDNDSSSQYVNIEIELDGEKVTIENAYSDNKWASLNQIKIYAAQLNTDDGITDLPSSVKTFISKIYTDFTSKYNDESFRNIMFAKNELKIDFTSDSLDTKYAEFLAIQKRQFDSYEDQSESVSIFANWWDLVLPTAEAE